MTSDSLLPILLWVTALAALLWLVATLISRWHQKAYNLTSAESAPSQNIKPDFLKAPKGGHKGIQIASDDAPSVTLRRISSLARILSLIGAIGSVIMAIVNAWILAPETHRVATTITNFDEFVQTVKTYWIGFTFAAIVIVTRIIALFVDGDDASGSVH